MHVVVFFLFFLYLFWGVGRVPAKVCCVSLSGLEQSVGSRVLCAAAAAAACVYDFTTDERVCVQNYVS